MFIDDFTYFIPINYKVMCIIRQLSHLLAGLIDLASIGLIVWASEKERFIILSEFLRLVVGA